MMTANNPLAFSRGSPNCVRLFPNYVELEKDYFKRTRIYPIMHTVVIRREIYDRDPWVAMSLYKAFCAAKDRCYRMLLETGSPKASFAWLQPMIEEEQRIIGNDWYPYGVEANRETLEALTLYSFSTENWGRPGDEVDALMALLVRFLHEERDEIMGNQIRLTASGNLSRLPEPVQQALQFMIEQSSHHSGMVLNLALSYGSRQELVRAVQALAREVQAGTLAADDINEDDIERHLDTAGLPDPDLVIRTSGELRLSNFLLWQVAYSELYITDVLWPDFRESDLMDALAEFAGRRRRFGKTSAQVEATP